jgi:hypothetical protein
MKLTVVCGYTITTIMVILNHALKSHGYTSVVFLVWCILKSTLRGLFFPSAENTFRWSMAKAALPAAAGAQPVCIIDN